MNVNNLQPNQRVPISQKYGYFFEKSLETRLLTNNLHHNSVCHRKMYPYFIFSHILFTHLKMQVKRKCLLSASCLGTFTCIISLQFKDCFHTIHSTQSFVSCLQERYFLMNTFYLGRKNWGSNEASPLCDCVLIGIQGWKLVWQQLGPQQADGQNGHCCKARSCCSLAQTARMSEQHGVKQQCQSLVLC